MVLRTSPLSCLSLGTNAPVRNNPLSLTQWFSRQGWGGEAILAISGDISEGHNGGVLQAPSG